METWRTSTVTGALSDVPGIGPKTIEKLKNCTANITNFYQLFGAYLALKGPEDESNEVTVGELNQKFWYYLKAIGIVSHRSAIVLALSEKASSFFPGFYDAHEDNIIDEDEE